MTRRPSMAKTKRPFGLAPQVDAPDAVTVLTVYVVLLYGVPSDLTFAALGTAGSPSSLWAMGAGLWWCWHQLHRPVDHTRSISHPVRVAAFVLLGAAVASYIAAGLRPLPLAEGSPADTGLLRVLSWLGVLLLAADGIPDHARFQTLVRRLVLAAGFLAALGLLQFATGESFVDSISIPGLSSTQSFANVQDRGGFTRSAATAMNPLEYAVVLCMLLPLAVTTAIEDSSLSKFRRLFPVVAISFAAVLSVSRSALLGVFAGVAVLAPSWPRRIRRWTLVAIAAICLAVYILVPGMVKTLATLFTGISEDNSAASRTNSYDLALEFFERNPAFGRGFGTFLPQYRILDNEYLLLLVEMGLVGLFAVLGIAISSIASARAARKASLDSWNRQMAQSLVAGIVAGTILAAFFDAFSFPKAAGTFFIIAGICEAHLRLTYAESIGGAPEHGSIRRGAFL